MPIEELTRKASLDVKAGSRLGHLACANNGQPYVTLCYFAYNGQYIYGFSTTGRKIAWLRKNLLACLQVDKVSSFQEWTSIVVLGRYE